MKNTCNFIVLVLAVTVITGCSRDCVSPDPACSPQDVAYDSKTETGGDQAEVHDGDSAFPDGTMLSVTYQIPVNPGLATTLDRVELAIKCVDQDQVIGPIAPMVATTKWNQKETTLTVWTTTSINGNFRFVDSCNFAITTVSQDGKVGKAYGGQLEIKLLIPGTEDHPKNSNVCRNKSTVLEDAYEVNFDWQEQTITPVCDET